MSTFLGMDVAQVRELAAQMRVRADEIDAIEAQLTAALRSVQWTGPDRQQLEAAWDGELRAQLRVVAEGLRRGAAIAEGNAHQQEQASGITGPGPGTGVAPGVGPGEQPAKPPPSVPSQPDPGLPPGRRPRRRRGRMPDEGQVVINGETVISWDLGD